MDATPPTRGEQRQLGQATVEWIGLLALIGLLLAAVFAAGIRIPGTSLTLAIGSRIICAVTPLDCGGGAAPLESAYGTDVAETVRRYTPRLLYEDGMHALPVDYRSCRSTACGDGAGEGNVTESGTGEPVTLFVHVIDCRHGARAETEAAGADCSGDHAGRLFIQYWEYYANSTWVHDVPGDVGYHDDDWEGTQFRINSDGTVDQRASSHEGYNYELGRANWGSDAGIGIVKDATEWAGMRPHGGWGPATGMVFVSGGTHAGNVKGSLGSIGSETRRGDIRLVPLEPIAAAGRDPGFAITPPWVKDVWTDPEAEGTG